MKQKQFHIAEYAIGGTIKIEISHGGQLIRIAACDYKQNTPLEGYNKTFGSDSLREMNDFLNELTSGYHADKVMKWIKPNLPKRGW